MTKYLLIVVYPWLKKLDWFTVYSQDGLMIHAITYHPDYDVHSRTMSPHCLVPCRPMKDHTIQASTEAHTLRSDMHCYHGTSNV